MITNRRYPLAAWMEEKWWHLALVLILFLCIGLFSPILVDKAVSAQPSICKLEDPERPCSWDYPPMHKHFVDHDKGWDRASPKYKFPPGHFFDVMHTAYYNATHGPMDQATKDAVAVLEAKVAANHAGAPGADPDCGTMFTCWWGGFRHDIECIGSVATQYGCTAATPDTPSQELTDKYMRSIATGTVTCGLTAAGMAGPGGPAVLGPFSLCMVGTWITAFFG